MSKKKYKRRPASRPTLQPVAAEKVVNQKTLRPTPPLPVPDNRWRSSLYWFLCVMFVALPFGLTPYYMNPYNKTYFVIVLTSVLGLLILATAIARGKLRFVYSPFFAVVGAWLLVKLITTTTSIEPMKSFWGTYNSWSDSFLFGLSLATLMAIIVTLYLEHAKIARLLHLLMAQAAVLSAMTLWEAYKAGVFYQKVRPDSPLLNSDYFLSYGLLFLPLVIILLVHYIRRKHLLAICLCSINALVLAGALFVTLPTHLQTLLLPSLLDGMHDSSFGASDKEPIGIGNFGQTDANLERWRSWKIGITLGEIRPLVGTGPSTTGQAFLADNSKLDLKGWDHNRITYHSHNDLIEQFSEEGLLGLAVYIALWAMFVWIMAKNWKNIDAPSRPYAWGLLGGLTLWLGFNLLLFTTLVAGLVVWTWIALLLTMVKSGRDIETPRALKTARAILIVLAVVAIVSGYWMVRYYFAEAAVTRSLRINTALNNGSLNHLPGQNRVNLQFESETDAIAAANGLPFEDYYSFQAAETSINTYFAVNFTNPPDAQLRKDNALRYAHQAVNDDPDSPENLQALGGIQFYLAPPGSASEQQGIALMNRAIALTPKSVAWYLEAAEIVALKKNYPLATHYIQRGLAQTDRKDHPDLKKLGKTIQKEQSA